MRRRVVLVANVKPGKEEDLIYRLKTHEPVEAFRQSGIMGCSLCAGKGHLTITIDTDEDFQTAYHSLFNHPSWKAMLYKIAPLVEGLPALGDFVPSAQMPFAGEITYWDRSVAETSRREIPQKAVAGRKVA